MFYPYIKSAGFIWMMPIVFLSICAMAFALERLWFWIDYFLKSKDRHKIIDKFFAEPFSPKKAYNLCAGSNDMIALVLREFLCNYDNMNLNIAERKTLKFAEGEIEKSRQFLDWLGLIANISGTLGLMGTVVGISLSFKSLADQNSKTMALSLSTAMYTTIGGIILFLISYLFLFIFQKFSNHLENVLDTNIQRLKDILEKKEKSQMIFEEKQNINSVDSTKQTAKGNVPQKEKKVDNKKNK